MLRKKYVPERRVPYTMLSAGLTLLGTLNSAIVGSWACTSVTHGKAFMMTFN